MSETRDIQADHLRRTASLLHRIEWAAKIVNPSTKFRTDTCPSCGGVAPGTYGVANAGHKPDCELAKLLAELSG